MIFVPSGPLPVFDREVISLDVVGIARWTTRTLRTLGIDRPLTRLHEVVAERDVRSLVHQLTERTLNLEVRRAFSSALLRALPHLDWPSVRMAAVLQFRVQAAGRRAASRAL